MEFDYDLVTSMAPLYYVSAVIGLITYISAGPFGARKFTKGTYHILYHVVYLFIHLFFIIMSFYMKLTTSQNSRFEGKIVIFNIYTSLFISLVVLLCHQLFINGVNRTLKEIYELDKDMSGFGIKINHSIVYNRCILLTLFLLVTSIWYGIITTFSSLLFDVYYWALFIIQYLITMTMKTHFCTFNVILKYRFMALDDKLREVINETKNQTEKQGKIILVGSGNRNPVAMSPLASKILTLSEYHSKLYNISKRINMFYSVQILLITGKYFVEITATLYYNLQKFYKNSGEEMYDLYALVHFIWAVMNALDLLVLVYASDSMCQTANNSKLTLHKVNLNSKDIEMKKEVTAFSLQLLHNDLVLTAAGFFNIDFTLIFNIIGAVTTYLVIFIQFDIEDKKPQDIESYGNGTTSLMTFSEDYTSVDQLKSFN